MGPHFIDLADLAPGYSDRAAIIGQTGSGKSYLAAHLLDARENVVVHDGKGTTVDDYTGKTKPEWEGYKTVFSVDAAAALNPKRFPRIIYRPPAKAMLAGDERFFGWVFRRKYCTLYVDEVTLVQFGGLPTPNFLSCITRGREFGISVWLGTQRPAQIPKICLTEAQYVYSFFLKDVEDRKRVSSLTGIDADDVWELAPRQFMFSRQSDREAAGPMTMRIGEYTDDVSAYDAARLAGLVPVDGLTQVLTPPVQRTPVARGNWLERILFG